MLTRRLLSMDEMRMVTRVRSSVCAVLFVTVAHPAQAGINVWTSHAPGTVGITALAIDRTTRSTFYIGTAGFAVFKSTDAGGTWRAAGAGLPSDGRASSFRSIVLVGRRGTYQPPEVPRSTAVSAADRTVR